MLSESDSKPIQKQGRILQDTMSEQLVAFHDAPIFLMPRPMCHAPFVSLCVIAHWRQESLL